MSVGFYLLGGKGPNKPADTHQKNGDVGVIAYTQPLKELSPLNVPAINPTFGNQMARDAAFTGTPDVVHDGIDSVAWTGTNIVGARVTFNSTNQFHSGSNQLNYEFQPIPAQ